MFARLFRLLAAACLVCLATISARAADCSNEATYKSPPGGTASDIYFHNGAGDQRRVYWLDENGQRKLKVIVEAGQTQRQSTIASHMWVVTDAAEKCLYVIEASSAPITAEIGSGASAPAAATQDSSAPATQPVAQPAVSPITKFALSGWYQIAPLSKPGRVLNNLENGAPEVERVKDEWESPYWEFAEVPGTQFVTIKNKWTRKYLGVSGTNGLRTVDNANPGQGAQWGMESAGDGLYARFKSRLNGRYLSVTPGGFEFLDQPPPGNAGLWQLSRSSQPMAREPEPVSEAKPRPPRHADDDEDKPDKPRSRKCPKGQRFDSDRLDCVSIKCGRHQVYSKDEGQCLDKSDTCSKHEVYSSSMQQCIPKSAMCESNQVYSSSVGACIAKSQPKPAPQPKPVAQPKAPKCAYKTDGVGNCLTPAFLQCQKAFGACMKACGGKGGKCEANCEGKYAGTCGD